MEKVRHVQMPITFSERFPSVALHSGLLQSHQFAFALYDVFVIPLDLAPLFQPPLEISGRDLIRGRIACFGRFETALGFKAGLVEGLAAPE
jgi:hypothetical protein